MLAITEFSTWSNVIGLVHIATAVVAFGPTMIYPSLRRKGGQAALASVHTRTVMPALVLVWVSGMGLAGMSKPEGADDPVFHLSQGWLSGAVLVWIVVLAASWFLIRPAITDDSPSAKARFSAGVGITHVGLVVALVLMIWKPGL